MQTRPPTGSFVIIYALPNLLQWMINLKRAEMMNMMPKLIHTKEKGGRLQQLDVVDRKEQAVRGVCIVSSYLTD